MMRQPTDIRILKKSVNMTERVGKNQIALKHQQKLHALGEQKTIAEARLIQRLQEQYEMDFWLGCRVKNAESKNQWHIMKTMTNILKLFGYVNHVISKDTKKFLKIF